ncbi:MAG: SCP2 sterol-binding domain-containing protein [Myxococcota bacterium]
MAQPEPIIALGPGAEGRGLTDMLATLLRQNLDEHADKRAAFARMVGRVAIVVSDLGSAITLHFQGGRLTVHYGVMGIPDVTIRTSSEWLTKMSLVELEPRFGLPDLRNGAMAKEVGEAQKRGEIEMHGMLLNLPLVLRLTQVMSVV